MLILNQQSDKEKCRTSIAILPPRSFVIFLEEIVAVFNRAFSLTRPAPMQIYWNKRTSLHKKGDLPKDWFNLVHPTWLPFPFCTVLEHQIGRRDYREVMSKRSILLNFIV